MTASENATTGPSREEHKALLVHHMARLRAKKQEVDKLREPLKAAQEELTALYNEAKADLGKGYTRKYLTLLLEDSSTRLRDLLQEEERRAQDRAALGLPVFGVQGELFGEDVAKLPDETRDEIHWEAEGYARGRNGLLDEIPDGCPTRFHQAVLRGYERGQKATQDDILAAQELIARRGQPNPDAAPADLNNGEAPEPGTPEAEAAERKAVRRARESLENLGAQSAAAA